MRNHTKKISTLIAVLALFGASLYAAYAQGAAVASLHPVAGTDLSTPSAVYSGVAGFWAAQFSLVMNALMSLTGNNLMSALILLALIVEVVLLYPSVSIQLKQKKIHLFHKKLVDRFESGELALSATQQELHKLYDVNEKIHSRGAILVVLQIVVLVGVLAGLNLILQAKVLVPGLSSGFNTALLSKPISMALPLLAGLFYAFHSLIKIAIKEREDYISPTQTGAALAFTVLGSAGVYYFASLFPVALSVYAVTLMAFATLRILFVEEHARSWGRVAHEQLINMLRNAKPHSDRFQYISRKWNHLPIVRHVNFHLLEEALSMSLGLLVALNILGAFQAQQGFAQTPPTESFQACTPISADLDGSWAGTDAPVPSAWNATKFKYAYMGVNATYSATAPEFWIGTTDATPFADPVSFTDEYCAPQATGTTQTPLVKIKRIADDIACQTYTALSPTVTYCPYHIVRSSCPANIQLVGGLKDSVLTYGPGAGSYKTYTLNLVPGAKYRLKMNNTIGSYAHVPLASDTLTNGITRVGDYIEFVAKDDFPGEATPAASVITTTLNLDLKDSTAVTDLGCGFRVVLTGDSATQQLKRASPNGSL